MKIKKGVTRIVLIFQTFVIKIPNFTYSHQNFLIGCTSNWNERHFCKIFKGYKDIIWNVSPSIWCSWFGIIQIQKRCKPLNRDLTKEEKRKFKITCNEDFKKENFGYYNNKLVCLDYG